MLVVELPVPVCGAPMWLFVHIPVAVCGVPCGLFLEFPTKTTSSPRNEMSGNENKPLPIPNEQSNLNT